MTSLMPWAIWRWRLLSDGMEGGGRERRTVRDESIYVGEKKEKE